MVSEYNFFWLFVFVQISNGMENNGFGTCSELIFAPIDRNIPNESVLLASGFRVYSMVGSNTVLKLLFPLFLAFPYFFGLLSCLISSYSLVHVQDILLSF